MRKLITLLFLFISSVTLAQRVQYFNGNGQSTTSGTGSLNQVLSVSATGVASWVTLPAASAVTSVFGRTGAVVSATNDYTFSQIGSTPTTIAGYGITDFNTLGDARYGRLTGSTNASGIYAVTFGTAYSVAPNIQVNMIGGTNKTTALTTVTTTGFSIYVQLRADVLGLLPTYSNVNAQPVDVLVTEK